MRLLAYLNVPPRSAKFFQVLLFLLAASCSRRQQDGNAHSKSVVAGTESVGTTAAPGGSATGAVDAGGRQPAASPPSPASDLEPSEDPASPSRWQDAALAQYPLPSEGPRLYAKTRHVWIYAEPNATKQWIGYLWSGGSVRLRSPKPRYGIGCEIFYAIEPRGYVCVDGGRATTDPNDPVVVALHPYAPRATSPWPHRYGESRGAPLYYSLPSAADQAQREPGLKAHLARLAQTREQAPAKGTGMLLGVDLTPAPEQILVFPKLSPSVHEAHAMLKHRSTVAYSKELRHEGRDFLLTADFRFIPKDRVVPYPVSKFHGLRLGVDAKLPLAFVRQGSATRFRRDETGKMAAQGGSYPRLSHAELTGKSLREGATEFLETKSGDWVNRDHVVLPVPAEKTPWNAPLDQPDNSPLRPKGRATWIEVSIRGGWLIAYEDTTPSFVTLISPGRGGEPIRGRNPLETSATPVGRFSITGKFVTSTMVAPNDYLHSDVPYAQNFTGPYALHSAYWHDNWGNLMSGGCINLAPIDALFMYNWTEPPAPEGWHGTRWLPYLEPATTLIVHR